MSKKEKDNSIWLKIRKFVNDIHLWGGLISGIIVFVVCLTGTIYVYNTELREIALSEYYKVEKSGEKISPDALLAMAKPSIEGKVLGIKVPFSASKTTAILFQKPSKDEEGRKGRGERPGNNTLAQRDTVIEKKEVAQALEIDKSEAGKLEGGKPAGEAVAKPHGGTRSSGPQGGGAPRRRFANQMMVNPYTGELIGDVSEVKTKMSDFMQKMFGLHRWLLLNEVEEPIFDGIENRKLGSWITGTATLLFLLGVLTGLVIWFPKKIRTWKNGLKIRWSANWKRVNHDLHNTLGLYTWLILFLMAVTGPFWSFEWYREGWQKTWGTYQNPNAPKEEKAKPVSAIVNGKATITIEETILAVNKALPYDGDITINFASDSTGTLAITKNRVGFFAPSAGDKLTLNQYSGEVLEKDIFREKSFRHRIGSSIKALHIGDVYGPFTKLLYFISCLVATSLPITGVFIWINKMKKPKKKKRASARPESNFSEGAVQ